MKFVLLELDFGASLLLDLAELELDFAPLLDSGAELLLVMAASEPPSPLLLLDSALLLDTLVSLELDCTELDELETEELDFCSELELASLLEDATELLNAWQAG